MIQDAALERRVAEIAYAVWNVGHRYGGERPQRFVRYGRRGRTGRFENTRPRRIVSQTEVGERKVADAIDDRHGMQRRRHHTWRFVDRYAVVAAQAPHDCMTVGGAHDDADLLRKSSPLPRERSRSVNAT